VLNPRLPISVAVEVRIFSTRAGESRGFASSIRATMPAMWGVAIDVPLNPV
jgi:hypothetical protein